MGMGEKIKKRREELHLSVDELAHKINKNRATVYRYENEDIEALPSSILIPLAKALNTTPGDLIGWDDNIEPANLDHSVAKIPVLGRIPAGIPMEAIEDINDYVEIPKSWLAGGAEYFSLEIKGDSMSPRYETGDIVIFKRQETCETGDDCAVMINGDDATFKRIERQESGIVIKPLNPNYETKFYTNKQIEEIPIRVIGVAIELRRNI